MVNILSKSDAQEAAVKLRKTPDEVIVNINKIITKGYARNEEIVIVGRERVVTNEQWLEIKVMLKTQGYDVEERNDYQDESPWYRVKL
jgi:hypothetical protein